MLLFCYRVVEVEETETANVAIEDPKIAEIQIQHLVLKTQKMKNQRTLPLTRFRVQMPAKWEVSENKY